MTATEKFSAKEAAIQLGTDARTLRKFIRSSDDFDAVGQGNRYEFTSKEIKALKKKFDAWNGKKSKPAEKPSKKETKVLDDEVEVPDDEATDEDPFPEDSTTEEVDLDDDDEPVDLSDLDPDDDEIEEIELDEEDL